jgi:AraC-like DNA-binding protein
MASAPQLYRPRPPLSDYVEYFGYWRIDGPAHTDRALPRGAATMIVEVGPRQRLNIYASDGRTRFDVPPAFVAGPHSISHVSDMPAEAAAVAIHFRPSGALPFVGIPLGDLENAFVGLEDIWGNDGKALHEKLIEATSVAARFALLEDFLLSRARFAVRRHPGVAAVMEAIEVNPSIRVSEARELAGLSTKRMIALFRAEVGMTPKAYARVRRFQAALRRLRAGAARGAGIAADVGYFDQAHFVREFRAFAAMTPMQYQQHRIILPSHVPVNGHKYPIPRPAISA